MSNGTSGDCNSINFREAVKPEEPYERIHRVANDIAELARDVYAKLQWHPSAELKAAHTELKLGVRKPNETQVQWAKDVLAKAKKQNGQYPGWGPEVYALETLAINDFPDQVPVFLQAFRIGGLGIAATPCETFAELGLELKKKSAVKPCFTIELANGHSGYLPTPAQHKLGGYETWRARSSYLETDAAPKIQAALLNLFEQVK
jgi:neutral ceramidase